MTAILARQRWLRAKHSVSFSLALSYPHGEESDYKAASCLLGSVWAGHFTVAGISQGVRAWIHASDDL